MQHQPPPSRAAPSFSTPLFPFPFAGVLDRPKIIAGREQTTRGCSEKSFFLSSQLSFFLFPPSAVGAEVARGLSLFGGASSEVRRCNCSVGDESRSSLAARCVSFCQIVCLSVCRVELHTCRARRPMNWPGGARLWGRVGPRGPGRNPVWGAWAACGPVWTGLPSLHKGLRAHHSRLTGCSGAPMLPPPQEWP